MEFLSLLIGIIGTLLAVWVAVAGRQLLRPRFVLRFGLLDLSSEIPIRYRLYSSNSAAVGISAVNATHMILHCPLRLTNKCGVPVSDVEVVLEFPQNALIEDTGLIGPVNSQMARVKPRYDYERKVYRFGDLAQVRIPIGILRPRETYVLSEFLQFQAHEIRLVGVDHEDKHIADVKRRIGPCKSFRGVVRVRAMVWSSSRNPVTELIDLMWLAANDVEALEASINELAQLSWEESTLVPGTYFSLRRQKPLVKHEIVHLFMMKVATLDELTASLAPDHWLYSDEGGVVLKLPPWGLWGESFDIKREWGHSLLRAKR